MADGKHSEVKFNPMSGVPETISDPTGARYLQNLRRFEQALAQDPEIKLENFMPPARPHNPLQQYRPPILQYRPPQQQLQPIIIQQPAPVQSPLDGDKIKELQNKMSGIEKENKDLQDYMKRLLILDNPRLVQSFYPTMRPLYDPNKLINAALENEITKQQYANQTLSKLRDIYGEDAPAKYLERSLSRLEPTPVEYKPVPYELGERKPIVQEAPPVHHRKPRAHSKTRTKSKSKPKAKSASKSKSKSKKK